MLQFGLSGGKDEQTLRLIVQLQSSPEVHLLLKENLPLVEPPADALWKPAFLHALETGRAGRWLAAAGEFQALADKAGAWPAIARNIAVLQSWLARRPAAVRAWRTYAAGEVSLDDAVEAQASATLLDDEAVTSIDVVRVTYPIQDIETLLTHLGIHRQALRMPGDLRELAAENEPPPKGYFSLLDRPKPDSGAGLTLGAIPQILGQVAIYGKQTDREARLELMTTRPDLAACQQALRSMAGNTIGDAAAEESGGQLNAVDEALALKWYLPDDTPGPLRRELLAEGQRQQLFALAGIASTGSGRARSAQAARDPKQRIAVLAAILILELGPNPSLTAADYNRLRRKLELPEAGTIDPTKTSVLELP